MEEAVQLYRDSVLPAARKQKGYRAASLMTNPKTGKCLAITYWDKEEDALANERSRYYQEQLIKYVRLFLASPVRDGYEVSVLDSVNMGKQV
jgi:hypothetical protein